MRDLKKAFTGKLRTQPVTGQGWPIAALASLLVVALCSPSLGAEITNRRPSPDNLPRAATAKGHGTDVLLEGETVTLTIRNQMSFPDAEDGQDATRKYDEFKNLIEVRTKEVWEVPHASLCGTTFSFQLQFVWDLREEGTGPTPDYNQLYMYLNDPGIEHDTHYQGWHLSRGDGRIEAFDINFNAHETEMEYLSLAIPHEFGHGWGLMFHTQDGLDIMGEDSTQDIATSEMVAYILERTYGCVMMAEVDVYAELEDVIDELEPIAIGYTATAQPNLLTHQVMFDVDARKYVWNHDTVRLWRGETYQPLAWVDSTSSNPQIECSLSASGQSSDFNWTPNAFVPVGFAAGDPHDEEWEGLYNLFDSWNPVVASESELKIPFYAAPSCSYREESCLCKLNGVDPDTHEPVDKEQGIDLWSLADTMNRVDGGLKVHMLHQDSDHNQVFSFEGRDGTISLQYEVTREFFDLAEHPYFKQIPETIIKDRLWSLFPPRGGDGAYDYHE